MTDNEATPTGGLWRHNGRDFYRIENVGAMDPFLMSVVSSSDLWMFLSSAGSLTAGRTDADHSIFPYRTDDLLHQAVGASGPVTVIARTGERTELWRPFSRDHTPGCTRSLAKSVLGDHVVFEEHHHAWGVRFRSSWAPANAHGWVRTVELIDESGDGHTFDVLDGVVDVVPDGVDAQIGMTRSNLASAYRRAEIGPWGRVGLFTLESLISDRAEPGEALTATVVWSAGFDHAEVVVDTKAVDDMVRSRTRQYSTLLTGRPAGYLLRGAVQLEPGSTETWSFVLDTNVDHAGVVDVTRFAATPGAIEQVMEEIEQSSEHLTSLIGAADAQQVTGDPLADAHHLSNVLFNSMRGGVFPNEHDIPVADFADFVRGRNRHAAARHHDWLHGLSSSIDVRALRAAAGDTGDPQLQRLVLEYLPLTFSRRHGDPSRPWNKFAIRLRTDLGEPLLSYEGNWRDIFQNWEALLRSYPAFIPNVVAKFLNASTIDGFNPYRISRDGIDWEVPDPDDPWSHIGYWGDHQIVYLMRLLVEWDDHDPGAMESWLDQALFSFADVPYLLADHQAMVDDPRNTITFDENRAAAITEREPRVGTDGRLVLDDAEGVIQVTFAEKLVIPALAKLSSFVPGGGIWLNTQRPEWNDANNALAGPGLSMVTLFHLRGYLAFVGDVIGRSDLERVTMTPSVATWLRDITATLAAHRAGPVGDADRRRILDELGRTAEAHRATVAHGISSTPVTVEAAEIELLCSLAEKHLDATIQQARRPDGLYHSYNRVSFPDNDRACVDHLGPMLEGQVAALSSPTLGAAEAIDLIDALYASDMYRPDQNTFMLYPATELPPFPERNRLSEAASARVRALTMPEEVRAAVFSVDADGDLHFRANIVNAAALANTVAAAALANTVAAETADPGVVDALLDVYEEVFDHGAFTGRSGRMHRFEGLGSVYWHMVAKLLLGVQEIYWRSVDEEAEPEAVAAVARAYRRVRAGLGFVKDPSTYGAIPTDCYSHTPAGAGAQQPGMTGQVKEEILTRFGELGIRIAAGRAVLTPGLLPPDEVFPTTPIGAEGEAHIGLCGVPLTIGPGEADQIVVQRASGDRTAIDGHSLPREDTVQLLSRDGSIAQVQWLVGPETLTRWRRTATD